MYISGNMGRFDGSCLTLLRGVHEMKLKAKQTYLLKRLSRIWAIILVWMNLEGQLLVGLHDGFWGGILLHLKGSVVI